MPDQVVINSPFGPLVLSPEEISAAGARAKELLLAVGLASDPSLTPSEEDQPSHWLSIDEVAQLSNLKKSWLYQEIRSDRIPHRRFGRQVRIPSSYLAEPDSKSGANGQGGQ